MRPFVLLIDHTRTLLSPLTNAKEKRDQVRPAATKEHTKEKPSETDIDSNKSSSPITDLPVERRIHVARLRRYRVRENESDKAVYLPVFFLFVIGSALKHSPQY